MHVDEVLALARRTDDEGFEWLTGLHAARLIRSAAHVARHLLRMPTHPPLAASMGAFHEMQLLGWAWDRALLEALRLTDSDDLFVLNVIVPEIEAWFLASKGRLDEGLRKGLALAAEAAPGRPALHLAAVAADAIDRGVQVSSADPRLLPELLHRVPPRSVLGCPLCAVEMLAPGEDCDVCGADTAADAALDMGYTESLRWDHICPSCHGPRHALAVLCPRCGHRHP